MKEPLLTKNDTRFTLFPIEHPDIYDMYKESVASFWTAEEIDLADDIKHWAKLTDNEKHFIKHILAFFAASDGIVNENLAAHFHDEVQYAEARAFYTFQLAMETIHSETYSLLIDTYITDSEEKSKLFDGINTIPYVRKKADWALKWMNSDRPFAERLLAFACVEGILFSSSFCSIFWLKNRGLMPGLAFANSLISRDEASHSEFALLLYNKHLKNKLSDEVIYSIVNSAVELEKEFVKDALPVELIGMNSTLMCQYLEFVADRLLQDAGVKKLYNSSNPFAFMDQLGLRPKANFFETRVGQYRKFAENKDVNDSAFSLDSDF